MTIVHFVNQCVELLGARQQEVFALHGGALDCGCGIAVNHTGLDRHVEHMAKNRNGVVVASRRYVLAIVSRPLFASVRRDLTNFGFIQTRPASSERQKTFSPVMPSARFDAEIVLEIAQMHDRRLVERHFPREFAVSVAAGALPMLF